MNNRQQSVNENTKSVINNKGLSNNNSLANYSSVAKSRIKPKFFKLLGLLMNYHFDPILNYLNLKDIGKLRQSNKMFLALVHEYYPKRLRLEVEKIRQFQEENYDIFLNYMKIIDSQIPISNKGWLDFDLNVVIEKLKILDKNIITSMKTLKCLGKLPEYVFAPFCIIMGFNVRIKS